MFHVFTVHNVLFRFCFIVFTVVLVNIIESYCPVNHGETAASYSCCLYTAPVAWGLNGQQEAGNKKKLKRNDLQKDKAISMRAQGKCKKQGA